MKIGLFSDIHGNLPALEAVLSDMDATGVDTRACLGDLVAFGPHPKEVLSRLKGIEELILVRGNTDRWLGMVWDRPDGPFEEQVIGQVRPALHWTLDQLADGIDELVRLPVTGSLDLGVARLLMEHASPGSDVVGIVPETPERRLSRMFSRLAGEIFVCGHTHRPFQRHVDEVLVINVGSVGLPYDGIPRPSWVLLEVDKSGVHVEIRRVDYDRESVRKDMETRRMPWREVFMSRLERAEQ
jgi:predicted phosphodiesterase